MGEKKSIWLRWRLFAHKHNNRLLYAMMGLMFSAQMIMVYKHLKGERVVLTKEELFEKGPVVIKMEEYLKAAARWPILKTKRKDPFKENEDQ